MSRSAAVRSAADELREWTRQEATVKATGVGLAAGQRPSGAGPAAVAGRAAGAGLRLFDLELGPGYVASLAVCCEDRDLVDVELSTFSFPPEVV